jgi:cytochrome c-type biogenesis protein CcmE
MSIEHPSIDSPAVLAPPFAPARAAAPARQRKRGYGRWIGVGLLLLVVGLIASTVRPGHGAFTYSKYVDEVMVNPSQFVGQELRVEGLVEAGSVHNQPGTTLYEFRIERNHRVMPVQYHGIIPDAFRDGVTVTVRGQLGRNGVFDANEVVAKCPSRYDMQSAQAQGQHAPHPIAAPANAGAHP